MKKKIFSGVIPVCIVTMMFLNIQISKKDNKITFDMIATMAKELPTFDYLEPGIDNCTKIRGFCAASAGGGQHCVSIIDPDAWCK